MLPDRSDPKLEASFRPPGDPGSPDRRALVYDRRTRVEFEGRQCPPANLERGDVLQVDVREVARELLAEEIRVVRDVRAYGPAARFPARRARSASAKGRYHTT